MLETSRCALGVVQGGMHCRHPGTSGEGAAGLGGQACMLVPVSCLAQPLVQAGFFLGCRPSGSPSLCPLGSPMAHPWPTLPVTVLWDLSSNSLLILLGAIVIQEAAVKAFFRNKILHVLDFHWGLWH